MTGTKYGSPRIRFINLRIAQSDHDPDTQSGTMKYGFKLMLLWCHISMLCIVIIRKTYLGLREWQKGLFPWLAIIY